MPQSRNAAGEPSRRSVLAGACAALGWAALGRAEEAETQGEVDSGAPVRLRERLRITRLETFPVQPRWLFLKVHTDAGIVGLGEPMELEVTRSSVSPARMADR